MTRTEVLSPATPRTATFSVSLFRLYTLRIAYLILAVGLGTVIWPTVLHHSAETALTIGIRFSLLAGLGLTAILGLRYPVQMIPLLLFELTWKAIYLLAFALPLWRSNQLTPSATEDIFACALVVIFIPLIPWRYVIDRYIAQPGERWR